MNPGRRVIQIPVVDLVKAAKEARGTSSLAWEELGIHFQLDAEANRLLITSPFAEPVFEGEPIPDFPSVRAAIAYLQLMKNCYEIDLTMDEPQFYPETASRDEVILDECIEALSDTETPFGEFKMIRRPWRR